MDERNTLTARFEANRTHLRAVAYRMLGSQTEADDAVQEAWLHLTRAGTDGVENLGGWLTTVVARVCLDMLRSRKSRREERLDAQQWTDANAAPEEGAHNPERDALLADSVGLALLVVLETLAPAERVAFVLHDLFDLSFEEIAPIVGRTPTAARQLASRARRRVQGVSADPDADVTPQRAVVDAFLAASRGGNFDALLALLDPNVVLRADRSAVDASVANRNRGAPQLSSEIHGPAAVAGVLSGRARGAQLALVDGVPGAVWAPGGTPRGVFTFTLANGKIASIDVIVDPAHLAQLDLVILEV